MSCPGFIKMIKGVVNILRRASTLTSVHRRGIILAPKQWNCTNPASDVASDDISDPILNQTFEEYRRKNLLLLKVKGLLKCSHREAEKFIESSKYLKVMEQNQIVEILRYLLNRKVPPESIMENPWLLLQPQNTLREKCLTLHAMQPRELLDFVPLLRVSLLSLLKIQKKYESEGSTIPGKHRVYYLSDRLEVEPKIVSKYLSTHQFMFFIAFSTLQEILDLMVKYNVAPMNILKDLWAFRYNPKSVEFRLDRARQAEVEKPMPWMVRCPVPILEKSLQISVKHRALLGSNESTLEYLSERLGYDLETMRYITSKHPAVLRVRMTKIKEILDFLLLEEGFTTHDIAQVPRILCHSLETTRTRLAELKGYGCVPSTLVILCRSQREYEKFVNNWLITRERLGLLKENKE
ncbi:transcription termination factor, mitochondrial [Phlebotomus papatasi]|uniref:transcription termination factor, mitochondrial n=1 Tax=Phlebotomus papatasi TaxID=29031 RepID=UPI002483E455|nr:transcription termination factor, mitochondrial [Phlebotomus papatasi]